MQRRSRLLSRYRQGWHWNSAMQSWIDYDCEVQTAEMVCLLRFLKWLKRFFFFIPLRCHFCCQLSMDSLTLRFKNNLHFGDVSWTLSVKFTVVFGDHYQFYMNWSYQRNFVEQSVNKNAANAQLHTGNFTRYRTRGTHCKRYILRRWCILSSRCVAKCGGRKRLHSMHWCRLLRSLAKCLSWTVHEHIRFLQIRVK